MKAGSLVFLLLALPLPSVASAQSPCSRVGQVICDSKSGMEMRCEQTASQITPIITGKRCGALQRQMYRRGIGVSSGLVQAVRGRKGSPRRRAGPNLRSLSRLQVRLVGRVPAVAFDRRCWALLPTLQSWEEQSS